MKKPAIYIPNQPLPNWWTSNVERDKQAQLLEKQRKEYLKRYNNASRNTK